MKKLKEPEELVEEEEEKKRLKMKKSLSNLSLQVKQKDLKMKVDQHPQDVLQMIMIPNKV